MFRPDRITVVAPDADTRIEDVMVMDTAFWYMMGLRFRSAGRAWFAFDGLQDHAFGMGWVGFGLDMAFCDEDGVITEIIHADPMTPDPRTWHSYRPEQPYKYVLETEQGLLAEHDIAEGQRLTPVK